MVDRLLPRRATHWDREELHLNCPAETLHESLDDLVYRLVANADFRGGLRLVKIGANALAYEVAPPGAS